MTRSEARAQLAKHLKEARLKKKLSRSKIAKTLKVPITTIQALEDPANDSLTSAHRQGLSARYAQVLGLESPELKLLLKEARGQAPSLGRRSQTKSKRTVVFSRLSGWVVIGLILLVSGAYVALQVRGLSAPPELILTSPSADSVSEKANIKVAGIADDEASVLVNGEPVVIDETGQFSVTIYLIEGQNIVDVRAINSFSKETVINRTVYYLPIDEQR